MKSIILKLKTILKTALMRVETLFNALEKESRKSMVIHDRVWTSRDQQARLTSHYLRDIA